MIVHTQKDEEIHLVIIDPNNDFMGHEDGSAYSVRMDTGRIELADLPVKGAVKDMQRLARFINKHGMKIHKIHVTLDSHIILDVGHSRMWQDKKGNYPRKFTQISAEDIAKGEFAPRDPNEFDRVLKYAYLLESTPGNYKITIWSDVGHCLLGTWGHNVYHEVNDALRGWSIGYMGQVNYVMKGMNPWTEHYGALMAEVPDPSDPSTLLNTKFLEEVRPADKIVFTGEALSHCFMRSVDQFAEHLGEEYIKKFVLFRDCTSPIPAIPGVCDFPAIAEAWIENMKLRGMVVTTSDKFFLD